MRAPVFLAAIRGDSPRRSSAELGESYPVLSGAGPGTAGDELLCNFLYFKILF